MSEKLREILRGVCTDSETVRLLREDVRALADRYKRTNADRERLEKSHALIVLVGKSPEGTVSPITITDC